MDFLEKRHFWLRRLHSLLGVIPIGFFLLEHFFTTSYALQGAKKFDEAITFLQSIPYLPLLEILFIVVPFLFHGIFGIWVVYIAQNNILRYNYFRNWMFYLQRITALITLVFVIWHVITIRLHGAITGVPINFQYLVDLMKDPIVFIVYGVGVISAAFHFANGLWAFCITWGITIGPKAQRVSAWFSAGLFFILVTIGLRALVAFR